MGDIILFPSGENRHPTDAELDAEAAAQGLSEILATVRDCEIDEPTSQRILQRIQEAIKNDETLAESVARHPSSHRRDKDQ